MNRIGVVGDNENIHALSLCGIDSYLAKDADDATSIIDELAGKQFGIIFVTESIIKNIPDTILKYKYKPIPAIISIPNKFPSRGLSFASSILSENIKKATGTDIFIDDMEDFI